MEEIAMPVTCEICQKCGRLYMAGTTCGRCETAAGRTPTYTPPATLVTPQVTRPPTAPSHRAAGVSSVVNAPQNGADPKAVHALTFQGSGGSFLGIHIVNMLLSMVTLGIYYFWGKVKVRRYLYSQSEFNGDRFAYHGTGKELFLGFLRAALAFGAISILLNFGPLLPGGLAVKVASVVLAYCALAVFVPYAIAASRRYRMSRASWRGIRFSFRGKIGDFIRLYVKGLGLSALTLGIYYPYFIAKQQKFLVSHTYFGNERFGFDGQGRELFRIYFPMMVLPILAVILAMVVPNTIRALGKSPETMVMLPLLILIFVLFGLGWFWFQAARQRYLWNHTTFGSTRFEATMTGGRLLLLKLGNTLLLVLTLGMAWPWVMVRNINFVFRHLSLQGAIDLASIQQEAQSATAIGEGLDTLMDVDVGFAA